MIQHAARILIGDHQEVLRIGVRDLISSIHDIDMVAEASDGLEALELARSCKPDIAIVEHALQGLNGLDLTRRLQKELPATRVIVYTACFTEDLLVDYVRAGAHGVVLKIDRLDDLKIAMKRVLMGKTYFSSSIYEALAHRLAQTQGKEGSILTPRERQIVQLVCEGHMNRQIAYVLGVSPKTVETHRAAAMSKLSFTSTAQLVRFAVRNNLVTA